MKLKIKNKKSQDGDMKCHDANSCTTGGSVSNMALKYVGVEQPGNHTRRDGETKLRDLP